MKINKTKKTNFDNRRNLVLIGLVLVDIILIIWAARKNIANYVLLNGENIYVGNTRNLLFGRNYITLVITAFIYGYGVIINSILLKNKVKIRYLLLMLVIILVINIILFYIFTNRVY